MASEPLFFLLQGIEDGPHDAAFFRAEGSKIGEAPRCPRCGRFVGMREVLPPFRVELEVYRFGLGDLVHGAGGDVLASERFMEAFQSEKLTGVERFDLVEVAEVVRKGRGPKITSIPRYFLMKPFFARAAVDEARSVIRRWEPIQCTECRETGIDGVYGFRIEPGTWQGEDIFRPRGFSSDIVVSERFAQLVKNHGFTNIKLVPTEEFVWDPLRLGRPPPTPLT
jgi:hypothetical protein